MYNSQIMNGVGLILETQSFLSIRFPSVKQLVLKLLYSYNYMLCMGQNNNFLHLFSQDHKTREV